MSKDPDFSVGRGKPPIASRFEKGQSGNPRGRPKRKIAAPPYEAVLGQIVPMPDQDGRLRTITMEQAFLEKTVRRNSKSDIGVIHHSLNAIKKIKEINKSLSDDNTRYIFINNFLFSINEVLLPLRMVHKLRKDGTSPRIVVESWLVQDALARFADHRLTVEEQREVWGATRTPDKVQWPPWWTERCGTNRVHPKGPERDEDGFYAPCVVPRGLIDKNE